MIQTEAQEIVQRAFVQAADRGGGHQRSCILDRVGDGVGLRLAPIRQ